MIAVHVPAWPRERHAAVVAEYGDGSSRIGSRWGYGPERLPMTLDELDGPTGGGRVELPLHLAWSGLRVFDISDVKLLLGVYRIVLNNGSRVDFVQYLDGETLIRHWPILRKMLGRGVRRTWEEAFPELRTCSAAVIRRLGCGQWKHAGATVEAATRPVIGGGPR